MNPVNLLTLCNMEIPNKDLKDDQLLGSSKFGTMYNGTWNGVQVAIKKCCMRTLQQHLEIELNIFCMVPHPNIVQFYGACIQPGKFKLVFEFMPTTLRDLIDKSGKIAFLQIVIIAQDIAAGVGFLHSKGVLDTGLKSANVFLTENYRAKLRDFGLNKFKLENSDAATKIDTVRYRAPESFNRNYAKTPEADVYSLGTIMWELYAWNLPFKTHQESEVVSKLQIGLQENIPVDCPKAYAELIKNCWNYTPDNRPKISDVKERLTHIHLEEATKK